MSRLINKEQKLEKAAQSILSLIAKYGVENVSHSRVSRSAGVSRAWLYKYVGSQKEDLASFAVERFGSLFAQLNKEELKITSKDSFVQNEVVRLEKALETVKTYPELIQIYYRFRGTPTSLGRSIDKIERSYFEIKIQQLAKTFGVGTAQAKVFAELLAAIKLSFIHCWTTGKLKKEIDFSDYIKSVSLIFESFKR